MPPRETTESRLRLVAAPAVAGVEDLAERRRASRSRHPSAALVEVVVVDDEPPPAA